MCYPCVLCDCFQNTTIASLKKNFLSHPNIISQPISYEAGVCFLCIQNAEHTYTHKLWEATTDQWSSFQCICFWGMEVLLVQEGLIQITNQNPSWASLKKVCYLHTKNVTVKRPSSGMLLSRVFVQFIMNVWNQFGNHCFFVVPCMLHLCSPQFSEPRGWGGSVSKAMERAQHKFLTSSQKDPPHSNFPSDTVTPWRGSGDEKEACSSSSRWDRWWNSSCKGRSGGKYLNIHSLMQSTDEVYSVVASGSFAHRKKEMFRK